MADHADVAPQDEPQTPGWLTALGLCLLLALSIWWLSPTEPAPDVTVRVPSAADAPAAEGIAPMGPLRPSERLAPLERLAPVRPLPPIEPLAPAEPLAPLEPLAPAMPMAPMPSLRAAPRLAP